jgi:hypothetical protein
MQDCQDLTAGGFELCSKGFFFCAPRLRFLGSFLSRSRALFWRRTRKREKSAAAHSDYSYSFSHHNGKPRRATLK